MPTPEVPLALITGASRGIGLAIAHALAPTHALLLVARSEAALAENAKTLAPLAAGPVTTRACDLLDEGARKELCGHLPSLGVHVLVNNAGIAPSAPLARTDDDMWARTMALNLTAPFELSRAAAGPMAKGGYGRIINVASTAALKGYRYTVAYSASKAGLLGMTRAMALDVATKGVTVNAVCPGFTDTEIVSNAVENIVEKTGQDPQHARASLEQFNPQRRLIAPSEVASLVAYLASDAAAGVTGQALAIDGGETA